MVRVLLKIRYDGVVTESGGRFTAGHHHITMAKRVFRGGPWRPLSASRDDAADWKRRKSNGEVAARAASAEALHAPRPCVRRRTRRCGEHGQKCGNHNLKWVG